MEQALVASTAQLQAAGEGIPAQHRTEGRRGGRSRRFRPLGAEAR